MDGWSAPILVRELLEVYARHGSAASLPRVTPYRDYLTFIARQDRAAGLAAWREALAGLEEGTRLAPRPTGREPLAPEQIVLSLDPALSASLNRAAREQALTLNTVMQTAWGILLGRLSGRDDVVFGVTVAGRPAELAGVEHMVGLFINTLPLRMQLPPELPLSALLRQTQDSQSRLMAHQHLGLAEIQQAAGVGDLFDTLLVFENYPVDRAGLAAAGLGTTGHGLKLGQVQGRDATHYPLALIVQPGETLQLRLDYRPDLFERADVEAHRPSSHPAAGGRGCGRRTAARQPADPGGRRARHHPADLERHDAAGSAATLPALFAAQAVRTPDAVAVVFEDRTLTYAALDAHANRLAHHLHSLGVGPETMVGLCVERSPEMLIGLLGILKAGGAYLPLDPNYPRERLAFMLADAGCPVLVTQAALLDRLPDDCCSDGRRTVRSCGSMPTQRRSRASPQPRRRSISIRAIRPTSSTPRARPARRRASW